MACKALGSPLESLGSPLESEVRAGYLRSRHWALQPLATRVESQRREGPSALALGKPSRSGENACPPFSKGPFTLMRSRKEAA
jgi:hypothetical protein